MYKKLTKKCETLPAKQYKNETLTL